MIEMPTQSQELNFFNKIVKCFLICSGSIIFLLISGSVSGETLYENTNGDRFSAATLNADEYRIKINLFTVSNLFDLSSSGVQKDDHSNSGYAATQTFLLLSNDDCADAITINCGQTITGDTDEANPSGLSATCGFYTSPDAKDVFYTFEADGVSDYLVSVSQPEGSIAFDAVLFIYSGSCDNLVSLGCSDSGDPEEMTLEAPPAGIYTIRFFDYAGTAEYMVSLECFENSDFDCPALEANVGDECIYGDNPTESGVINDNCECAPGVVLTPDVGGFNFTMYPNPADLTGSLTLTSKQAIDRYEVLDITGKVIDERTTLNQNEIKISLSNYSSGFYILKAFSGSNFSTQKIVVR